MRPLLPVLLLTLVACSDPKAPAAEAPPADSGDLKTQLQTIARAAGADDTTTLAAYVRFPLQQQGVRGFYGNEYTTPIPRADFGAQYKTIFPAPFIETLPELNADSLRVQGRHTSAPHKVQGMNYLTSATLDSSGLRCSMLMDYEREKTMVIDYRTYHFVVTNGRLQLSELTRTYQERPPKP